MPEQFLTEPNLRLILSGLAVLCAIMGFVRGIGRLLLMGVAVAAGVVAGMAWLRHMPGVDHSWWKGDPEDFIRWGALVAGILAALVVRMVLNVIFSAGTRSMNRGSRLAGGLLGLIPALLLLWGGAVAIRWAAVAGHLHQVAKAAEENSVAPLDEDSLLFRITRSMDQGVLGDIMNRTDFLNSRESEILGTLLVLQRNESLWRERVITHAQAGPVVLRETFRRLQQDGDVQHAVSEARYGHLLSLPELDVALKDQKFRAALLGLNMEQVLHDVLGGHSPERIPKAILVPEERNP